jgi:hypothetical protein
VQDVATTDAEITKKNASHFTPRCKQKRNGLSMN